MSRKSINLIALTAGLLCLLVYLRALGCGFVNFDDPEYVLNNDIIRSLDWNLLVPAFTQAPVGWWMPLTWISFAIDYHFWGLNPFGYHLTNILLHAANTGLVVILADKVCRNRFPAGKHSQDMRYLYPGMLLLAALLFGIHPLRVESVAWVTERKDVLNGLFSIGSLLFYLRYAQKKVETGETGGTDRDYFISLVLFSLSLMAKSVSVVIPVMLLVADWYPLGRFRKGGMRQLLTEKLPYFILSGAMSVVTIYFTARSQYLVSYEVFPFVQRLLVSGNAIFEYCRLLLWPVGITPLHVIPDPIPVSFALKAAVICLFSFFCIVVYKKWAWVPAVWLCFVIPLVPVLAFFQNGDQAFAARFTYLPSLAPSILAAVLLAMAYRWGAEAQPTYRYMVVAVFTGLLVVYVVMTLNLIKVWENSETAWSRVLQFQPLAILFKERGNYYYSIGNYGAAVDDYSTALEKAPESLKPYVYNLYAFRGEALRAAGLYDGAVRDFTAAISIHAHPVFYYCRGVTFKELGRRHEAEEDFRRAGQETGPLVWYWNKSK